MLDWDRDMDAFAALFGATSPSVAGAEPTAESLDGFPLAIMSQIRAATAARAKDLECFFQTPGQPRLRPADSFTTRAWCG